MPKLDTILCVIELQSTYGGYYERWLGIVRNFAFNLVDANVIRSSLAKAWTEMVTINNEQARWTTIWSVLFIFLSKIAALHNISYAVFSYYRAF